jgi:hypothetical protein
VVGGERDMKDVTSGTEEPAAIQYVVSTWLRKEVIREVSKDHIMRRRGD